MTSYGTATITTTPDGSYVVERADDVIGITVEILAAAVGAGLHVADDGLLWLAGDPNYRYRPVRFAVHGDREWAQAFERARVLVCERVTSGT